MLVVTFENADAVRIECADDRRIEHAPDVVRPINPPELIRLIEETHGENVLKLVLAVGYLRSLIANSRVVKFLGQHYAAILTEFQKIIEAPELDGSTGT